MCEQDFSKCNNFWFIKQRNKGNSIYKVSFLTVAFIIYNTFKFMRSKNMLFYLKYYFNKGEKVKKERNISNKKERNSFMIWQLVSQIRKKYIYIEKNIINDFYVIFMRKMYSKSWYIFLWTCVDKWVLICH